MVNSRSGAGGKIVTNRRNQRIAATPYDRPPPRLPPKSPSWFSGVVVPSARAIASGAGKIISAIFSESGSSSSEDEDYASEDDIVNDNFPEIPCNREDTLNEKNATSLEMMQYRQESQLSVWMSETKKIIEQLIMKETFSSEERDRFIKVLNSRVIAWSTEAGEKGSVVGSTGNILDHENADIFDIAVQEAKKWLQEKKAGLSSVTELAQRSSNLNSTMLEHVEAGGGSPVDLARSYMKTRSLWMSPGRNIELKTPSTVSMKLFREGTLYSAGHYSVSSCEADGECSASKLIPLSSPNHAEELHSDLHFSKVGRETANGLSSSQVSLSTGMAEHDDQMENHVADTSSENIINAEGNCELLIEAYMDVPIMTETSTASGCRYSLGVQYEDQSLGIAQLSPMEKRGITGGKQQERKASKYYRRSRGRGK